ncbi:MAG: copper-binding protein [Rhodocyclaceae bacterium]|nr:copper-binding protein [Rhodocyclaceae bacterium]
MNRVLSGIAAGVALLCLSPAALVAAEHDHHAAAPAAVALTNATVKKIDKAGSQVTLAHGPIENLGMSAMTMAFRVKEPKFLAGIKVGDKVRFLADYSGGEIVVVRIEAAK